MTSMVEVLPPHLPLELELPEGSGEVLELLKALWLRATPDSIGRDLQIAHELAATAPPGDAVLAQRYVVAIGRLERWLRDS
jgi:hypothetical protein